MRHELQFEIHGNDMEDMEKKAKSMVESYTRRPIRNADNLLLTHIQPYIVAHDGRVSLWSADASYAVNNAADK